MVSANAPATERSTTDVKNIRRRAIEGLQKGETSIDEDIAAIGLARRPILNLSWEPTQEELTNMISKLREAGQKIVDRADGVQKQLDQEAEDALIDNIVIDASFRPATIL